MSSSLGKRSRASSEQLSRLVDFMLENLDLATGKLQKLHGKMEYDKRWSQAMEMLNSLGGTIKTVEQWQTVWRDLKSRTSIKVRERRKQQALNANLQVHQEPLTELERRVISIIGSHYVEGHECVAENVAIEEEFQLRLNDCSKITNSQVQSSVAKTSELGRETPNTTTTYIKRTPRALKRKCVDTENDTQSKLLEISETQADAMKLLAECSAVSVDSVQLLAEAIKSIEESLKANADAINNLAGAIDGYLSDN